jgi:hypothetical protein
MTFLEVIPPNARKAYSEIESLVDVLAGRTAADEKTKTLFSKLDYQSILDRFLTIFTETLLLNPSIKESRADGDFLKQVKFAFVYALTPTL